MCPGLYHLQESSGAAAPQTWLRGRCHEAHACQPVGRALATAPETAAGDITTGTQKW